MSFIGSNPKWKTGGFTPQSVIPVSPRDGDVYRDDGTNKAKGLYEYKDGAWVAVGSSSSSGINYITNGDASQGILGWARYADAAAASPVDGTGGSPDVAFTFATNSSSPLRGALDFLITKDANNRQGHGVSYDFTIANADMSKPLQIKFNYKASAGFSFANNDIAVFVYSKDGSALVAVTPNTLDGSGTFVGQFQTDATPNNDYRLIFHVATVNAGAWTMNIDDVQVGPVNITYGAPVTDWTTCTMACGLTGATGLTVTAFEKRVGDTASYRGRISWSAVFTGGVATVSLPSGRVIDGNKAITNTNYTDLGDVTLIDSGSAGYVGDVQYNDTSSVVIRYNNTSGAYTYDNPISTTVPFTWANADYITFEFTVPIAGWSSNVVMSSDAGNRVVAADIFLSGDSAALAPNNSAAKIPLNAVNRDTTGSYDIPNTKYVCPENGFYNIDAQITLNSTNVLAAIYYAIVYKNGAILFTGPRYPAVAGTVVTYNASRMVALNKNDYIELTIYGVGNNSVNTITAAGGSSYNFLSISKISSPQTIAASEFVGVYGVAQTPTGTLAASHNVAIFGTIAKDTHNAYNTTTGIYAVPVSGWYHVTGLLEVSATFIAGEYLYCSIYHKGAAVQYGYNISDGTQARIKSSASLTIYAARGDTIAIYSYASIDTPTYSASSGGSTFSIAKVS